MARENMAYGFAATTIAVPATAASAMPIIPVNKQVGCIIQYLSGGSMEIFHFPLGSSLGSDPTVAGSSVVLGNGFLLNSTRLQIDGAPRFYLAATGATAVAQLLIPLSLGV